MTVTVKLWSGDEVRALREAKRMSIRAFAGHLGVSERMVSKWEAGGAEIHPRPVNQAALDTSLATSSADVHERFRSTVPSSSETTTTPATEAQPVVQSFSPDQQIRHPGDGKLMTLVEAGTFLAGLDDEPVWLPAFYIDVYPTTNADYARFVAATGYTPPKHWAAPTPPEDVRDHPVVFVTHHDASAYAAWAGKALPTSPGLRRVP